MHSAHTETFRYKLDKGLGHCATPAAAAGGDLCLAQGHLNGNSTPCSFNWTSFSSNVATTECRRGAGGARELGGWVGVGQHHWHSQLLLWDILWRRCRSKVWLGLVNRHPLYRDFAAASHISQKVWLAPSWRSTGGLTVCKSWLYIKQVDLEKKIPETNCYGMD